jgi:hypothetical protein
MFLPDSRRLLEADGIDVFMNSTSVSSTISGADADVVVFVNVSYNASGEGMVDFGEADFGKFLSSFDSYLPVPCSTFLLEKLTVPQPVKKLPAFYATRRFITAFTSHPPPIPILNHINPVHYPILLPEDPF